MRLKDMQDIDELMRIEFKDAVEEPPAEAWSRLQQGLQGPAPKTHPFGKTWVWLTVTAAVIMAAGAAVMLTHPDSRDGNATQDNNAVLVATNTVDEPAAVEPLQQSAPEESPLQSMPQQSSLQEPQAQQHIDNPVVTPDQKSSLPVQPNKVMANQPYDNHTSTVTSVVRPDNVANVAQPQTTTQPANDNVAIPANSQPLPHNNEKETFNLLIPNIITPNGDGINDCWIINAGDPDLEIQVQVFTAKSQRVFSSNNYKNDFCGDDLPDGNYFYVLTIKSMNYVRRGVLVIKRN